MKFKARERESRAVFARAGIDYNGIRKPLRVGELFYILAVAAKAYKMACSYQDSSNVNPTDQLKKNLSG